MRKTVTTVALAFALVLAGGATAEAITGNFTEDFEHEYVGLAVFYTADGTPSHRCSGSLLTDRVFLTAGHCVTLDDSGTLATSARVYFEQDVQSLSTYPTSGGVSSAELYSHGFEGLTVPETRDVGVLVLDAPVTEVYPEVDEYASLADVGTLDEYKASHRGNTATMTVSGYGLQYSSNGNPDKAVAIRERLQATTFIIGLNNALAGGYNVQLSGNPGAGRGGTCFGDSGGPALVGDTDVVAAVTSFGLNGACVGTSYSYRTDTKEVIAFIRHSAGDEADEIVIV
jgi:secreted trypsin-like serine protease